MRDSINYNLNYFIMRMSDTKPMKNTMRKKSPNKMLNVGATVAKLANTAKKAAATAPPAKMKSGMGKKC